MARATESNKVVIQSAKLDGPTMDSDVGSGSKIYPGHLLMKRANGMILHNAAYRFAAPLIATHHRTPDTDTYAGSAVLQTAYAKGETVYFVRGQQGDIVRARIKQSESTVIGRTLLASDGAGHVLAAGTAGITAGTAYVGLAWETITTAGSAVLVKMLIV